MSIINRNGAIWQDYTDLDYRGIENPLKSNGASLDVIGSSYVRNGMFIVDDKNRIMLVQLDDMIKLGNDTVSNDMAVIDLKAETQRTKMALESATNDYVLAVVRFADEVKSQIMEAKMFALELSRNEVTLSEKRATLADEKAAIQITETGLKIKIEELERKHVEIEKLRAELSVAKANTQLIMSEIDVKKAELAVINGQVQKAMAEVDKIELTTNVAITLADLLVRQIAGVRLESERADLSAIAQIIAMKLDASINNINTEIRNVQNKERYERDLLAFLGHIHNAKIRDQDHQLEIMEGEGRVQLFKEDTTKEFLEQLREIEELITESAIKVAEASNEKNTEIYRQNARDASIKLRAVAEGYTKQVNETYTDRTLSQHIVEGSSSAMHDNGQHHSSGKYDTDFNRITPLRDKDWDADIN